jgi:hypothetical protein
MHQLEIAGIVAEVLQGPTGPEDPGDGAARRLATSGVYERDRESLEDAVRLRERWVARCLARTLAWHSAALTR